jgi:hypothetical protein
MACVPRGMLCGFAEKVNGLKNRTRNGKIVTKISTLDKVGRVVQPKKIRDKLHLKTVAAFITITQMPVIAQRSSVAADSGQLTHFPFITLTKVGCALC